MEVPKYKFIHNSNDVFHVYIFVPAGSIYETPALHGASHMLEHMLFKNSSKQTNNLSKALTYIGGKYNAVTYKDVTYYFIKTPVENYKDALDMIHQIVAKANFTAQDLQVERKVVIEEFNQTVDNFNYKLEMLAQRSIYNEENPYGKSVIGSKKVLQNVTDKALKEYYHKRYQNFTVLINCPQKLQKKCEEHLTKLFGPNTPLSLHDSSMENIHGMIEPKVLVINRYLQQYMTRVMFPSPVASDVEGNMIMEFVSYVLTGSGLYSLLNHDVREVRGLVYTVQSYVEAFRYTGMFTIQFSSSNKETEYILSLVYATLYKLVQHGLSPKLFKYYQSSFLNSRKIKFANDDYRTEWNGTAHFYGCMTSEKQYLDMIKKMTPKQVQEKCKEIFDFDKQSIISVGSYPEPNKTSLHIVDMIASYNKLTL